MRFVFPKLAIAFVIALGATRAWGQESDDDRKMAAKLFGEGQKAYREGDFRHAAEAFEGAYKRAPRLPPLYNAARAWQKGGEIAHAANLYASYLRKAPPSAPDRNSATSALRDLDTKLARLELHAADISDLKVDGVAVAAEDQPPSALVIYVTPGTHLVDGTRDGKPVHEQPSATAGTSMSVVLAVTEQPVVVQPPVIVAEKSRGGISPIVVIIGAGATVVAGGFLLWSGLDTTGQRNTFDASPTQANLDTGKSDELRTNVLLGVTLGLAAITAITTIFVDWKGKKSNASARLHFGPMSGMLEGTF